MDGFLNASFGLYLASIGYSFLQVGIVVTTTGFLSATLILVSGILSDRANNRRFFLIPSAIFTLMLGAIYASTACFSLVLAGATLGGAGSAGGGLLVPYNKLS